MYVEIYTYMDIYIYIYIYISIDPNAAKVLEVLHRAVAVKTGKQLRTVRAEFRARSSIALRLEARAFKRTGLETQGPRWTRSGNKRN